MPASASISQSARHRHLWKSRPRRFSIPAACSILSDPATGEMIYRSQLGAPSARRGTRWMEEDLEKKRLDSRSSASGASTNHLRGSPHYLAPPAPTPWHHARHLSAHGVGASRRLGLSPREALAAATNNYSLQFGWNDARLIAAAAVPTSSSSTPIHGQHLERAPHLHHHPRWRTLDRNALLHLKK